MMEDTLKNRREVK